MELNVLKYPHPKLKEKSEEIKEITPEISQLVLDMIATMDKEKGIGLAAPQIGILQRLIVVYLITERSPDKKAEFKPQALINPKIIKKSGGNEVGEEGCLSFPGLFLEIKRIKNIEVSALNMSGQEITIKAQGLSALVLQHEIDHLDGILFIDRAGFWQRLKLKCKLDKIF